MNFQVRARLQASGGIAPSRTYAAMRTTDSCVNLMRLREAKAAVRGVGLPGLRARGMRPPPVLVLCVLPVSLEVWLVRLEAASSSLLPFESALPPNEMLSMSCGILL